MVDIRALLENDEQLTAVTKQVFDSIDTDGSGRIDKAELKNALVTVATDAQLPLPSDADVEATMKKLDVDNSGTLDVNELKALVRELLRVILGED